MSFLDRITEYFAPQENWPLRKIDQFERQRRIQALWIGILAFFLPIALFYGHLSSTCFRDTISHSYYLPFWGDIFVATACCVATLLFFYRGQSKRERYLAVAGACCAILVALNPTDGSGCDTLLIGSRVFYIETGGTALTSAFPNAGSLQGEIHLKSAIALFLVLAVFNLFVFTATDKFNKLQSAPNNRNKRIRNAIYRATGIAMIASLIGLGFGFQFIDCDAFDSKLGLLKIGNVCTDQHWYDAKFVDEQNWFFYLEWACLACFGISWIVKGRAGGWLLLDEKPNQIISRPSWLER